MTAKRIKPSASQRAVKRLQEQIDMLGDNKARQRDEFARYKYETQQIMDAAVRRNEYLSDVLVNNNVKITELENQVANQYKENSALRQDMERFAKRYNENVADIKNMRKKLDAAEDAETSLHIQLADARELLRYRVYLWYVARVKRIREAFAIRKERIINSWKVRRLNKARVSALNEAGYIPEKLIKAAHQYWEADKVRATETIAQYDGYGNEKVVRQTWFRRLRILLGRA